MATISLTLELIPNVYQVYYDATIPAIVEQYYNSTLAQWVTMQQLSLVNGLLTASTGTKVPYGTGSLAATSSIISSTVTYYVTALNASIVPYDVTGTVTGSCIANSFFSLVPGANVITTTGAGSAIIVANAGTTVTGTCISGSPVTLANTGSTTLTITAAGTFTVVPTALVEVIGTQTVANSVAGDGAIISLYRTAAGNTVPATAAAPNAGDTIVWTTTLTHSTAGMNIQAGFDFIDTILTTASGQIYYYYTALKAATGGNVTHIGATNQSTLMLQNV